MLYTDERPYKDFEINLQLDMGSFISRNNQFFVLKIDSLEFTHYCKMSKHCFCGHTIYEPMNGRKLAKNLP